MPDLAAGDLVAVAPRVVAGWPGEGLATFLDLLGIQGLALVPQLVLCFLEELFENFQLVLLVLDHGLEQHRLAACFLEHLLHHWGVGRGHLVSAREAGSWSAWRGWAPPFALGGRSSSWEAGSVEALEPLVGLSQNCYGCATNYYYYGYYYYYDDYYYHHF